MFAVRDISLHGLGISMLEFGESLLFPMGYECTAELKLGSETLPVKVRVVRTSAWSVGLVFEGLTSEQNELIREFIDPLHIGRSLRLVDKRGAPEAFLHGMSTWYHGDSGTDVFLWNDTRGGLSRALFCLGSRFWEWDAANGVSTGDMERLEGEKMTLHRDATPSARTRDTVRKLLEHAEVMDYRLVSFLKDRL